MTEEKERRTRKPFTQEEKDDLKAKWATGNYALSDLAAQSGRTVATLSRMFKAEGVKKGQDKDKQSTPALDQIADGEVEDAKINKVQSNSERIYAKYKAINDANDRMMLLVQSRVQKALVETFRNDQPMELIKGTVDTALKAVDLFDKIRKSRVTSMGVPEEEIVTPDTITSIVITEMTAEEVIAARRKAAANAGYDPDKESVEMILSSPSAEALDAPKAAEDSMAALTTSTPSDVMEN